MTLQADEQDVQQKVMHPMIVCTYRWPIKWDWACFRVCIPSDGDVDASGDEDSRNKENVSFKEPPHTATHGVWLIASFVKSRYFLKCWI